MKTSVLLLCFVFISLQSIFAQIVGTNVFLKGNYVEAGINQCGVFGSEAAPPVGYHPTDVELSLVADRDMDGWDAGSPFYCGDYSLPGSPVEGWAIETDGMVWVNSDQFCASNDIPGSITDYTSAPGASSATWEGDIVTPFPMHIKQKTVLKTNKRYLTTTITITNTGATALTDVYYMRNIDPDNDQAWSEDYNTSNTVVLNPPIGTDALVTSEGLTYGCYLGIGARNINARVTYGLFSTNDGRPSDVWNGTGGYENSGTNIQDEANSISIKIPFIAAGASATISFVYIFSPDVVEEALASTGGGFVCANPTGITTTVSTTTANFNWIPVAGATGYTLKYRPLAGGAWTTIPVTAPPFLVSGLTVCTEYEYKIITNCAGAISPASSGTFTTACAPCASAPTGLFADNVTSTTAKLHWNADPDAIKYKVSYTPAGGATTTVNATSNVKIIGGLTPGTVYSYTVRTVCAGGILSPVSTTGIFTTLFRLGEDAEMDAQLDIYPNPNTGNFTVDLTNFNEGEAVIKLYDMLGNNISINNLSITESTTSVTMNFSYIANGLYVLSAEQNGFTLNKQVVIAK